MSASLELSYLAVLFLMGTCTLLAFKCFCLHVYRFVFFLKRKKFEALHQSNKLCFSFQFTYSCINWNELYVFVFIFIFIFFAVPIPLTVKLDGLSLLFSWFSILHILSNSNVLIWQSMYPFWLEVLLPYSFFNTECKKNSLKSAFCFGRWEQTLKKCNLTTNKQEYN